MSPVVVAIVALFVGAGVVLGVNLIVLNFKTRPARQPAAPDWRARMIEAWPDPIDEHIDTAAALLQPDAPFLPMSELDAAMPSKPITEAEDRDWRGIVSTYRFIAAPVVPGRSEP